MASLAAMIYKESLLIETCWLTSSSLHYRTGAIVQCYFLGCSTVNKKSNKLTYDLAIISQPCKMYTLSHRPNRRVPAVHRIAKEHPIAS